MTEQESSPVNISDYKEVLPTPASDDSLAKAIVANRFFASGHEEERDILNGINSLQTANTEHIWSAQSAKEERNFIFGSVVKFIAGSEDFSKICNLNASDDKKFNYYFTKEVLDPLKKWSTVEQLSESDKEQIKKMKQRTEESIAGVLWGLYKDDLGIFPDEYRFAGFLFPQRPYLIRPDSIDTDDIQKIKQQITVSN